MKTPNVKRITHDEGFSLVEALVGAAILVMVALAVTASFSVALRLSSDSLRLAQASFLLDEGMEAVRSLRDDDWAGKIVPLSTGTSYSLTFSTSTWMATTTTFLIEGQFNRQFMLDSVYRDGGGNIALSGTLDAGSRKVTVSVAWLGRNGTTTKTTVTYLMNIYGN